MQQPRSNLKGEEGLFSFTAETGKILVTSFHSTSQKQSSTAGKSRSETKTGHKPEEKPREEKIATKRPDKVVNLDRNSAPNPRPRQSSRDPNEKVKLVVNQFIAFSTLESPTHATRLNRFLCVI